MGDRRSHLSLSCPERNRLRPCNIAPATAATSVSSRIGPTATRIPPSSVRARRWVLPLVRARSPAPSHKASVCAASRAAAAAPSAPTISTMAANIAAWRISGALGTSPRLRASSSFLCVGSRVFCSSSAMVQPVNAPAHCAISCAKPESTTLSVIANSARPSAIASGWAMKKSCNCGARRAERPSAALNTMP